MKSKRPTIQTVWQEYKELCEDEINELSFSTKVIKSLEILLLVVPYILANFQLAVAQKRPGKKPYARNSRKNRNV